MLNGTITGVGTINGVLSGYGQINGSIHTTGALKGILTGSARINGSLTGRTTINGRLAAGGGCSTPPFTGDYEYTPTMQTQIIEIADQRATQNITIKPIPENYGLITWNGSYITVS